MSAISRLRRALKHVASGPSPTCDDRNIESSDEWGVLKTTAVQWSGWNDAEHKVLPEEFWGAKHLEVRRGDVLVTKAGPRHRVGVSAYVDKVRPRLVVSGKMLLLRVDESVMDPRYLNWQLSTPKPQDYLNSRKTGMAEAQMNFANEDLLGLDIILPPLGEQRRIADFLDREIGRLRQIDELRAEQVRLLDARLAAGLVDRLLPVESEARGWTNVRLKYLFDFDRNGIWGSEPGTEEVDVACVRVADFDRQRFVTSSIIPTFRSVQVRQAARHSLRPGDVLLERSGGGDQRPVGFAVTFTGAEPAVCSNFIGQLRPRGDLDSRFVGLLMVALYKAGRSRPFIKQTTGIQNLDSERYFGQTLAIPPLSKQAEIVRDLDRAIEDLNRLASTIQRQRNVLYEYSRSLITAAVTGQLDMATVSSGTG